MAPNPDSHAIPEGAAVSYTDDDGAEWAAVVLQHLPRGHYDVRLTDTREKVITGPDRLDPW